MKPKPTLLPPPPAREVKTYRYPGQPFIVFNPAPRTFIPMIAMNMNGHEVFTMIPDTPVCDTLELAQAYHEAQLKAAEEAKRPQLYVPPGRGKVQA